MGEIIIEIIANSHMQENCMFLHRDGVNEGILIDPGIGKSTILRYLDDNNYVVKNILITHSHIDHIYSCDEIRKKYNCDIYVSKEDEEGMSDIKKNASQIFSMPVIVTNVKTFKDGDIFNILDIKIKCILTPGHTKGSTCFYIEEDNILLSGDTLFYGSCGRTDLYGGSDIAMKNSLLNILFKLPKETKVFPGHGVDTTIGYEMENNIILSL